MTIFSSIKSLFLKVESHNWFLCTCANKGYIFQLLCVVVIYTKISMKVSRAQTITHSLPNLQKNVIITVLTEGAIDLVWEPGLICMRGADMMGICCSCKRGRWPEQEWDAFYWRRRDWEEWDHPPSSSSAAVKSSEAENAPGGRRVNSAR